MWMMGSYRSTGFIPASPSFPALASASHIPLPLHFASIFISLTPAATSTCAIKISNFHHDKNFTNSSQWHFPYYNLSCCFVQSEHCMEFQLNSATFHIIPLTSSASNAISHMNCSINHLQLLDTIPRSPLHCFHNNAQSPATDELVG
jgi:hypothetical protein